MTAVPSSPVCSWPSAIVSEVIGRIYPASYMPCKACSFGCSFAIVATGMPDPLLLSVLDQSPVPEGSTGGDALRNTLDLARLADELGYHRYWLAEHHNGPLLAGPSPEVLIGPVAMATSRLRVGSGGVMLPHYSPLKVAESFSVLAGLFPGRIDLGLGRAFGTDPQTAHALQRDRSRMPPDDFRDALGELLGLLGGRFPASHPLAR